MDRKAILGNSLLIVTAMIWGTGIVANVIGMREIGPYTFNAYKYFMSTLTILLIACLLDAYKIRRRQQSGLLETRSLTRGMVFREWVSSIKGGAICGTWLFLGSSFQQVGLKYTQAGKAGFITALYIVLVPLLGLSLKRKVETKVWLAVTISVIGLYLISITDGFYMQRGDFLVFIGALFWASHILSCDHFTRQWDPLKLSCIQLFVAFLLSTVMMVLLERPNLQAMSASFFPVAYAGILSTGIGFTLQMIAQKNTVPAVASLILSTEAVFAALGGFFLLREVLTLRELIGCFLLFFAIVIAQLPQRRKKNSHSAISNGQHCKAEKIMVQNDHLSGRNL